MKKSFVMGIAFAFMLLFIGCESTKVTKINFGDKTGSLTIANETSEDVVLFVGNVQKNIVLGATKAKSESKFNLTKISDLPEKGAFIVRAVPLKTYEINKNLSNENSFWSGLVTYDLTDDDDHIITQIPKLVDETMSTGVYVSNNSKLLLQVRANDPSLGEIVTTLTPFQRNAHVYMKTNDMNFPFILYPVFVYTASDAKQIIQPNKTDGIMIMPAPFMGTGHLEFNSNLTGEQFDSFFDYYEVVIKNYTSHGIMLQNGSIKLLNSKGIRFTQQGATDTYKLSKDLGWDSIKFVFDNNSELKLQEYSFNQNHRYNIIISEQDGSFNYSINDLGSIDTRINLLFE